MNVTMLGERVMSHVFGDFNKSADRSSSFKADPLQAFYLKLLQDPATAASFKKVHQIFFSCLLGVHLAVVN
jgi:hypothetical protein